MAQNSPNVSSTVSASLISLIVGGVIGFYIQTFMPNKQPAATGAGQGAGPGGPGGGGRMGGGGGGMGGGGGFGGAPSPPGDLARLVRNLDTMQKVQGTGLTPAQGAQLGPVLARVKSSATISDTDAQADTDAIQKILTPAQKDALTVIQPPRGGRGGGGARGGGGGMGGPGGGMGGPGGGGGQRAPQDPNKPFASERNQAALDDLIAHTGK